MDHNLPKEERRNTSVNHSKKWIWLAATLSLALFLSCLFICITGTALFFMFYSSSSQNIIIDEMAQNQPEITYQSTRQVPSLSTREAVPESITETEVPLTIEEPDPESTRPNHQPDDRLTKINPPDLIDREPLVTGAEGHLEALLSADYPARDYFEVAKRFGIRDLNQRTVYHGDFVVGDTRNFWTDKGSKAASLLAITPHAYFWFDSSLTIDSNQVLEIAKRFEEDFYPRINELWGIEWRPGIDNDPRFSILHLANFIDDDELGYFDSGDEYPLTINKSSNEQEIVYLNLEAMTLGSDIYYATLSHEVQHLIQWNNDPNEEAWLNEGLSQLTELLLGFNTVDTLGDYSANPNIQLNIWDYDDDGDRYAHYGAAYLFSVYLWERLGSEALFDLARSSANGIAAVSLLLEKYLPETDLIDFFASWSIANYLDDDELIDQYFYSSIDIDRPTYSAEIDSAPTEMSDQINQFSAGYVKLNLRDTVRLSFVGDLGSELIDAAPHSGQQMWFAPGADDLDAHLIHDFDLSGVTSANLEFWAWYDLEREYDFAYISASSDGGSSWVPLDPAHGFSGEFGPSFSGRSSQEVDNFDGWVFESISLDRYEGQEIQVRFDLITDSAIPGVGLAIDDISVPEVGFFDDVEADSNSWTSSGFVQTGWRIPQGWSVSVIQDSSNPTISPLFLDEQNSGSWMIDLGKKGAVLVISALAPFSTRPADYWLAVESANQ